MVALVHRASAVTAEQMVALVHRVLVAIVVLVHRVLAVLVAVQLV